MSRTRLRDRGIRLTRHGGSVSGKPLGGKGLFARSRPQGVEGALHAAPAAVEDMRVDHGGRDVGVPQEFLDGPDVVATLEEVGSEAVSLMPVPALAPLCRVPDYAGFRFRARPTWLSA